ncbi:hypothetical protein C0Q70_10052 [Pomacea canaliculata]|uniref:Uncharacterized protein n=1 Tax=Pomacea canaliculata TaxID=400727 RepID=A0A2T7PBI1_POMCA|nr:hypothetical protein C0Q70_10052 [Pomacea canaliculata]
MVSLDTKAKRKHGQYTRPEINGCLRLSDAGDRRGCRRRGDSKGHRMSRGMILKQFALTTHLLISDRHRGHYISYFIADLITQTVSREDSHVVTPLLFFVVRKEEFKIIESGHRPLNRKPSGKNERNCVAE